MPTARPVPNTRSSSALLLVFRPPIACHPGQSSSSVPLRVVSAGIFGYTRRSTWPFEVKYSGPLPSARNRPFTQIYGGLLADFNKLTLGNASERLVVLVADTSTVNHRTGRGGGQLLPFSVGEVRTLLPATARQIAMYLCRELTDLSLPRIGQRFGGRDHSTVMHAASKIRALMAEQRSTYTQIQELTSRIRTRAKNL
jgi:hypothetical protein